MKHQEVPQILIEQYRLGELSPEKAREIEKHPNFDQLMAELDRSDAEVRAAYPASQYVARITNQYAAETQRESARERIAGGATAQLRGRRVVRWLAVAVPGAAVLAIGAILAVQAFIGGGAVNGGQTLDETVRLKGSGPELSVYRSVDGPDTSDDEAEQLEDGATAYPGDRLQLAYNSGDREYGAIVSVDGRGAVTVHFPISLSEEPRLVVGRRQQLVMGYQLDDAPLFEHFYFITAQEPFSVQQLIQEIRAQSERVTERADSLRLGDEYEITSFTVRKGE